MDIWSSDVCSLKQVVYPWSFLLLMFEFGWFKASVCAFCVWNHFSTFNQFPLLGNNIQWKQTPEVTQACVKLCYFTHACKQHIHQRLIIRVQNEKAHQLFPAKFLQQAEYYFQAKNSRKVLRIVGISRFIHVVAESCCGFCSFLNGNMYIFE